MNDTGHMPRTLTFEQLQVMDDDALYDLVAQCDEEPADFDGCDACAAYEETIRREETGWNQLRML